jgi:hypothetical protein
MGDDLKIPMSKRELERGGYSKVSGADLSRARFPVNNILFTGTFSLLSLSLKRYR